MRRTLGWILLAAAALAPAAASNRNHLRVAVAVTQPAGHPHLYRGTLPAGFNPDSVRVLAPDAAPVPAKVECHTP